MLGSTDQDIYLQTEKFRLSSQSPTRKNPKDNKAFIKEYSSQFKKDDLRYRSMRKDLKMLEKDLKASKKYLNNCK